MISDGKATLWAWQNEAKISANMPDAKSKSDAISLENQAENVAATAHALLDAATIIVNHNCGYIDLDMLRRNVTISDLAVTRMKIAKWP